MTWRAAAVLLVGAAVAMFATGCGSEVRAATEATIVMRYSHFEPKVIVVPAGAPITFTLRNDDPIDHEWIVGSSLVHAQHRVGTEPYHDERSTEVTVPALSERTTTVTFERPGEYLYICHLPGHEDYGMVGVLRVVDR